MGLDILAFDRLIDKSRDVRHSRLIEEASILRVAVNSGFSGDDKVFKSFVESYTPEYLREEQESEKIKRSVKQISKLFGG